MPILDLTDQEIEHVIALIKSPSVSLWARLNAPRAGRPLSWTNRLAAHPVGGEVYYARHVARSKTIVYVDDRYSRAAGVQHCQQRRQSLKASSIPRRSWARL